MFLFGCCSSGCWPCARRELESRTAALQFRLLALCPPRVEVAHSHSAAKRVYSFASRYSLMACCTRHAKPRLDLVPQRATILLVAPEKLLQ